MQVKRIATSSSPDVRSTRVLVPGPASRSGRRCARGDTVPPADRTVGVLEVRLALVLDRLVLRLAGLGLRVVGVVVEELVRGLQRAAPDGLAGALDPLQAGLDVLCDFSSGRHF